MEDKSPRQIILTRDMKALKKLTGTFINDEGDTLLHIAAADGYLAGVKYLVEEKNYSIYAVNQDGYLPFHDAVRRGNIELIQWFLDKDSNLINERSDFNDSALHMALDLETFEFLLEKGADPKLTNNCWQTGEDRLRERGIL